MRYHFFILCFFILGINSNYSQVKIGNFVDNINPNAILELESKTKGLLLPRLQLIHTDSSKPLNNHVKGMMVYNTGPAGNVVEGVYINDGSRWFYLGALQPSDRYDVFSSDSTIWVLNGDKAALRPLDLQINHSKLAQLMKQSPYRESILLNVLSDSITKDTISAILSRDTFLIYQGINNVLNQAQSISSRSDLILVSGGNSSVLKDVQIGINDTILAGKLKYSPYTDSLAYIVENSDKLSDNISNSVLNNINYKSKTYQLLLDSAQSLVSGHPAIRLNGADSVSKALIVRTVINLNDTTMAGILSKAPYTDSLAKGISSFYSLQDTLASVVTSNIRFKDSVYQVLLDSSKTIRSLDPMIQLNNSDSLTKAVFRDISISVNDTILAHKIAKSPIVDSIAKAVVNYKPLRDSIAKTVIATQNFKDSVVKTLRDSAKSFVSLDKSIILNGMDSVKGALFTSVYLSINDTILASKLTQKPYTDSLAYAVRNVSLLKDSIIRTVVTHKSFVDSLSHYMTSKSKLSDSATISLVNNPIFRDSIEGPWNTKVKNGLSITNDTIKLGGTLVENTTISLDTHNLNFNIKNGKIVIGKNIQNPSAIFEIASSSKGVLIPRMTASQRDSITDLANGLLIYNTTSGCYEYFSSISTRWQSICGGEAQGTAKFLKPDCATGVFQGEYLTNLPIENGKFLIDVRVEEPGSYNIYGSYNGITISGKGDGLMPGILNSISLDVTGVPTIEGVNFIELTFTQDQKCIATVFVENGLATITNPEPNRCGDKTVVLNSIPVVNKPISSTTLLAVNNIQYSGSNFFSVIPQLNNGIRIVNPLRGQFPTSSPTNINFYFAGTPTTVGINTVKYVMNGISCQLELPVQSGTGRVSNLDCKEFDDSTILGEYKVGVPISDTSQNYKLIYVTANYPGTFYLESNTVNGIKFSNSVTLPALVTPQPVRLYASGTPKDLGLYTYTIKASSGDVTFSQCDYYVQTVIPNSTPNSASTSICAPSGDSSFTFIKPQTIDNFDEFANSSNSISISEDGKTLAISSIGEATSNPGINPVVNNLKPYSGAVYIYTRSSSIGNWSYQATIKPSAVIDSMRFGQSVKLSSDGNFLAVGAPFDSTINSFGTVLYKSGSVYLFQRNGTTWTQQAKIRAVNHDANDNFGFSLDMADSLLLVGSPHEDCLSRNVDNFNNLQNYDNENSPNSGAAYLYRRDANGWHLMTYFKAFNNFLAQANGDQFGYSVAISQDKSTIAIGARSENGSGNGVNPVSDENAEGSGAVYTYNKVLVEVDSIWQASAYIKSPFSEPDERFGTSVDLSNDGSFLVVGAPQAKRYFSNTSTDSIGIPDDQKPGGAFVFKNVNASWSLNTILGNTVNSSNSLFGSAVAISGDGNQILVGMPDNDRTFGFEFNGNVPCYKVGSSGYINIGAVTQYSLINGSFKKVLQMQPDKVINYSRFGSAVALNFDGYVMGVGSGGDSRNLTGVNPSNILGASTDKESSGAAYIYSIKK